MRPVMPSAQLPVPPVALALFGPLDFHRLRSLISAHQKQFSGQVTELHKIVACQRVLEQDINAVLPGNPNGMHPSAMLCPQPSYSGKMSRDMSRELSRGPSISGPSAAALSRAASAAAAAFPAGPAAAYDPAVLTRQASGFSRGPPPLFFDRPQASGGNGGCAQQPSQGFHVVPRRDPAAAPGLSGSEQQPACSAPIGAVHPSLLHPHPYLEPRTLQSMSNSSGGAGGGSLPPAPPLALGPPIMPAGIPSFPYLYKKTGILVYSPSRPSAWNTVGSISCIW